VSGRSIWLTGRFCDSGLCAQAYSGPLRGCGPPQAPAVLAVRITAQELRGSKSSRWKVYKICLEIRV